MFRPTLVAIFVPALLTGCGSDEKGDSVVFTETPSTIGGVLDTLPACELIAADGRLNVISGCADDVCVGRTHDEIAELMGGAGACEPSADGAPSVVCTWEGVIEVTFSDLDEDMEADKGDLAQAVSVHGIYDGGTTDGLGIGASSSCFLQLYGDPDLATWQLVYDHYVLVEATWTGWGLTLIDDDGPPGEVDPDGIVDRIIVSGAL